MATKSLITCVLMLFVAGFPPSSTADEFSGFDGGAMPSAPPKEVLNCLVCKAVVDEIEAAIEKVDPKKKVDVGSFRLDGEGNVKQNLVPYARSELHLSEVMDRVCSGGIKDYVVAHYKSSGRPTLLRLTMPDGNMNPEMSDVDIIPNPEVNDKLSFYCSSLVEEHEDDMISTFAKNEKDPHGKVCVSIAKVCPNGSTPSDEGADDDDFASEPYNFEHEEL